MDKRYPKIRLYRWERRGSDKPLMWHYICSTVRFPSIREAIAGFAQGDRSRNTYAGHYASTHGYYIED